MKATFWGAQGSYPLAMTNKTLRGKIKAALERVIVSDIVSEESIERFIDTLPFHVTHAYGGNTASIGLSSDDNKTLLLFDAGTGIVNAAKKIAKDYMFKTTDTVNLFVSHTHWDHIQGFPFFTPLLWMKGAKINVYSPMKQIKKRFEGQNLPQYLPFNLDSVAATLTFHEFDPSETIAIDGFKISAMKQYHPGASYAFRVDDGETSFGYTGDTELNVNSLEYFDRTVDFYKNAHTIVCDTQYMIAESYQKLDWGHSTTSVMLDLCLKAKAKRMIMFHHEPDYSDEKIDEILKKTRKYVEMLADESLEVMAAYEGLEVTM